MMWIEHYFAYFLYKKIKESFATYICLTIFWLECIFKTEKGQIVYKDKV